MVKNKTYKKIKKLEKISLLDVAITDASANDILEYVTEKITKTNETFFMVTPNPEIIIRAQHDKTYKDIVNRAAIALADGVGVVLAAKILQRHTVERNTGVDFMKKICEKISKQPITAGFLGGRDKVAEKTAECLQRTYPGLNVVFAGEEWGEGISNKQIDILFVAFGAPKQEVWMYEHIGKIPVRVMMGVGGAFDYISGNVSRAPLWVRSIGGEWLYRLLRQPWRWRRQVALLEFIWLVVKERLFHSHS